MDEHLKRAARALRAASVALSDTPTMAERVRRLRPGEEVMFGRYIVRRRTMSEYTVADRAQLRTVVAGPLTEILHALRKFGDA